MLIWLDGSILVPTFNLNLLMLILVGWKHFGSSLVMDEHIDGLFLINFKDGWTFVRQLFLT